MAHESMPKVSDVKTAILLASDPSSLMAAGEVARSASSLHVVSDRPLSSGGEWASKLEELVARKVLSPDCQVTLYWCDGIGSARLTDEGVELSIESLGGLSGCEEGCPLGQSGQSYLLLLAEGRLDDAFQLVYRDNPLPGSCGRVCHKCEPLCNRGKIDAPVRVATLKSFLADHYYSHHAQVADPVGITKSQRVAVVGSGPCGLSAARRLAQLGYPTTVFESMPVAGGQLAIGIPQHRLPREVVRREVDEIVKLGVEVRVSSPVDDVEALFAGGYGAVIVATGSHKPKLHPVVGDARSGVLLNTEFLADAKLGRPVEMGRGILVIGGGNVAMDCARSARRMGSPEVTVACIESWQDMPAHGDEVEAAQAEGIRMLPGTAILEVLRDGEGRVVAVVAAKVLKMEMGTTGSPVVHHDPESLFTLPCDTILLAMGQTPRTDLVSRSTGVVVKGQGGIAVDGGFATGRPGLFAAGDAVTVIGSVAGAIGAGNRVAEAVHSYLSGDEAPRHKVGYPSAAFDPDVAQKRIHAGMASAAPRLPLRELDCARRIAELADREVDLGMTESEAIGEARRCLACGGCSLQADGAQVDPSMPRQKLTLAAELLLVDRGWLERHREGAGRLTSLGTTRNIRYLPPPIHLP